MSVMEFTNVELTGSVEMAPYEKGAIFNVAQKTRLAPDPDGSLFGYATAIHNSTMIVGAYARNGNQGAAYAYRLVSGSWQLEAELTISADQIAAIADSNGSPRLGYAVTVWGDWAAVSATFSSYSGAVFLYHRENGVWDSMPKQTIKASQSGNTFGSAVSMDSGTLAVGHALAHNGQGAAEIHVLDGDTWRKQGATLTHVGDRAGPNQRFGTSISLNGNTVVAGGPGSSSVLSGTGAGEVFYSTRTGSTWGVTQALVPGTNTNDLFGAAVSVRGKHLVVGAPVSNGSQQGRVFVYEKNLGNVFVLKDVLNVVKSGVGTIVDATPATSTRLGYSVDVDSTGTVIAAGAPGYNVGGNYSGAIYVFEKSKGRWGRSAITNSASVLVGDNQSANRRLGVTVHLAAGGIAGGAPGSTTPGGSVYWFR